MHEAARRTAALGERAHERHQGVLRGGDPVAELVQHATLSFEQDRERQTWELLDSNGVRATVEHSPRIVCHDFPLLLAKQVFTNEDGSTGILYLGSSATTCSFHDLTTNYQRRWQVECYHKSLKQNVSLAKSPTQTVTTQTNHFFAALCGFIKLERLKMRTQLNHFALKSKLVSMELYRCC